MSTREDLLDADDLGDAVRIGATHLPMNPNSATNPNPFSTDSAGEKIGSDTTVNFTITVGHDAPTNPFVHTYHPNHDNLDARFENALPAGQESYTITRRITLDFEPSLTGVNDPAFGSTLLGGNYIEEISGVHKNPILVQGTFLIRRLSDIDVLNTGTP